MSLETAFLKNSRGLQNYPNWIALVVLSCLRQKMCPLFHLFPISFLGLYRLKYSLSFLLIYIVCQLSLRMYLPFSRAALSSLAPLSKCHPCTELRCNQLGADCQFINISLSKHQNCFIFFYWMNLKPVNLLLNWNVQQSVCSIGREDRRLSAQRIYRCLP